MQCEHVARLYPVPVRNAILRRDEVDQPDDLRCILWVLEFERLPHNRHQAITLLNGVGPVLLVWRGLNEMLPFVIKRPPHFTLRIETPNDYYRGSAPTARYQS